MSAAAGPTVVLCGPMGSGKTTTGRALATLLGVAFHDTDEAIEIAQGRTIADLFVEAGEAHFRMLEREEVARALATERGVLSVGGGAVLDPGTRERLLGRPVVFLDVSLAVAAKRIGLDRSRPLLAVNPRASWAAMMAARRPIYEQVASHRVDTDGRTPQEVAQQVARLLSGGEAAR